MMLVTYLTPEPCVGVEAHGRVAALGAGAEPAPTMLGVVEHWEDWREEALRLERELIADADGIGQPLDDIRLTTPIPNPPRNPFLIAGNYRAHVEAGERATGIALGLRKQAIFFTKPNGSLVGPGGEVRYDPQITQKLDYEVELVVVIGKGGKDIPVEGAMAHVFGYAVGNDISARDIQVVQPTPDFLRGKGLDTFFPVGPGIVPKEELPDYRGLRMRLWVNGELRQDAVPGDMTRDVPQIIAELSRGLTLAPGDLIATGTPPGTQSEAPDPVWLKDGDEMVAEIEGIGRIVNRVRALA